MAAPRYSAQEFDEALAAAGIEAEQGSPRASNDNTKQRHSGPREEPEPVCTVDRDDYVARCTELLKGYASSPREFDDNGKQCDGPAIQSVKVKGSEQPGTGGGDEWTCQVARNMGDEGISQEKCYELMRKHFNPECVPPWKVDGEEGQHKDRLRTKIANAYASRQDPIGSKTVEAEGFRHASGFDIKSQTRSASLLRVTCAADIKPKNIKYLWPLRLAYGKHSAFAGVGGLGKSQLLYWTAATVTTGGLWPCAEGRAPIGSALLLNAEDDQADMMVPRLIAAGADLKRVHIVNAVIENGREKKFNLLADLDKLYKTCRELGDVALIGFDPLSSYLGGDLDTHRDADLRHALDPISQMASAANAAVMSISHFNKGNAAVSAMNRVMGSAAFVNAPRAAQAILQDPESENHRLLLHLKTNMGPPPTGLRFHLEEVNCGEDEDGVMIKATHVVWDGATSISADAVVGMANERDTPRLDEAIEFLQTALKDGPQPVEQVKSHATALSITAATLRRARERIGVMHRQIKGEAHGGWEYMLPPDGAAGEFDD